jgi:multidrug efflux pump
MSALPPESRHHRASSSAILQLVTLTSPDGSLDEVGLGDIATRYVVPELRRLGGVGRARLCSTERAMRVWLDPDKLIGLNLTVRDVESAIEAQNAQVSSGLIGASPTPSFQRTQNMVLVKGQLDSPEEFGAIVLRANPNGSTVRLRDVARLEVGGQSYSFTTRLNGHPAASVGVQLARRGMHSPPPKRSRPRWPSSRRSFRPASSTRSPTT